MIQLLDADKILLDRIQRVRIEPLNKVDKVVVSRNHILHLKFLKNARLY